LRTSFLAILSLYPLVSFSSSNLVPIDTKVLCSDCELRWRKRHYFKDGLVVPDGWSSWTCPEGVDCLRWKYIKLAEELVVEGVVYKEGTIVEVI